MNRPTLREAAPALLIGVPSIILTLLEPGPGVWVAALSLPVLAWASLFATRWWSGLKPQIPFFVAIFSSVAVVHQAWVFNLEGEGILAWSALFALPPALPAVAVALRAPLARQIRAGRAVFVLIGAFGIFSYGMGAAYLANTVFDRGPAQHFQVTVKARFISSYVGILFKKYGLHVSAWATHRRVESVIVPSAVFTAVRAGDEVRLEQFPGFLGVPWVSVAAP
jgi:hypothetical protein